MELRGSLIANRKHLRRCRKAGKRECFLERETNKRQNYPKKKKKPKSSKVRNATYYTLTGAVIYRIGKLTKENNSEKYLAVIVHTKLTLNERRIVREKANSILGHISQSFTRKMYEVMLSAAVNICKTSARELCSV